MALSPEREQCGPSSASGSARARFRHEQLLKEELTGLSQRFVKCYAQVLVGLEAEAALQIMSACVVRVESNLGILRKAIGAKGYGELVDRVAASWQGVLLLCAEPPEAQQLDLLDARADEMLKDAERLTEFLEATGLVASLHVLNVAGRQRMLSQRITKLCFMLALEPSGARLTPLRELAATFQIALDYLCNVPLSSVAIRENLETGLVEWRRLHATLDAIGDANAIAQVSDASERLLDVSERLTDQYEQAMQVLIGDRIGRMG